MIGDIDNYIQLATTAICASVAFYNASKTRAREWLLLGLFSGLFFLGTLYYQLFYLFYNDDPHVVNISDLSWYTSYLFLLLLVIYINVQNREQDIEENRKETPAAFSNGVKEWAKNTNPIIWIVPVFTISMFILFIMRGDYFLNLVVLIFMTGIMWHAVYGLISLRGDPERTKQKMLFIVTLVFCLTEYALWISSLFWSGYKITNIYFWFDFLLSFTFLLFIPAVKKVVSR